MSRTASLVVIAVIVALLTAVWWIDRGRDRAIRPVDEPAGVRGPARRPAIDAGPP